MATGMTATGDDWDVDAYPESAQAYVRFIATATTANDAYPVDAVTELEDLFETIGSLAASYEDPSERLSERFVEAHESYTEGLEAYSTHLAEATAEVSKFSDEELQADAEEFVGQMQEIQRDSRDLIEAIDEAFIIESKTHVSVNSEQLQGADVDVQYLLNEVGDKYYELGQWSQNLYSRLAERAEQLKIQHAPASTKLKRAVLIGGRTAWASHTQFTLRGKVLWVLTGLITLVSLGLLLTLQFVDALWYFIVALIVGYLNRWKFGK